MMRKNRVSSRRNHATKVKRTTRRRFLGRTMAVGAGMAASWPLILTPGKAKASTVIRFAHGGGRTKDAQNLHIVKPFMEETGIEVVDYTGEQGLAKMKAMVKTGNLEFDVVSHSGFFGVAAGKEGLLEKLDRSRLDLSGYATPQWLWENTMAWSYYTGGIGYNTEATGHDQVARTWPDHWNVEKFPGRRGFVTYPQETLEAALMADGIAPKDLYPLDVERAFKSLDRIKPDVRLWVAKSAKTVEHLQTKELDFAYTYSGRIEKAGAEGFPLAFNNDMPISVPQNISIMKGTSNYDACMQLVEWMVFHPSGINYLTEFIGYGPTSTVRIDGLSDDVKSKLPRIDNPQACWVDVDWWGENSVEITKRYKEWMIT